MHRFDLTSNQIRCKTEKVQRGIQGELLRKYTASSVKLV